MFEGEAERQTFPLSELPLFLIQVNDVSVYVVMMTRRLGRLGVVLRKIEEEKQRLRNMRFDLHLELEMETEAQATVSICYRK